MFISTLLFAPKTWTMYRRQKKLFKGTINIAFEIFPTSAPKKRKGMLEEANLFSIEAIIIQEQLRWTSQVVQMKNNRLQKQLFYSQLKDILKGNFKLCNVHFKF